MLYEIHIHLKLVVAFPGPSFNWETTTFVPVLKSRTNKQYLLEI